VLQRAQEVIELQERGSSVQRLALRSLRQRDQRYMELAQQLVATQLEDSEQLAGLVKAVRYHCRGCSGAAGIDMEAASMSSSMVELGCVTAS
jgi:ferritin